MNCSLFTSCLLTVMDFEGVHLMKQHCIGGCRVLIDWHCLARMDLFLVCAGYVCVRLKQVVGILARGEEWEEVKSRVTA